MFCLFSICYVNGQAATLQHILNYPELMMTKIDGFYGLSQELREEIRSITNSANPQLAIRHTAAQPVAASMAQAPSPQVGTYIRKTSSVEDPRF